MPTLNPRVNVTLSPSLDRLVTQLAAGQKMSKSQVLRELLETAEPALQRVVLMMDAAEKASHEVREGLGRSLNNSTQRLERALSDGLRGLDEVTGDLVHLAEAVRGRRVNRVSSGARRGSAAVPPERKDPPPSKRGVKSLERVVSVPRKGGKS